MGERGVQSNLGDVGAGVVCVLLLTCVDLTIGLVQWYSIA